MQENCSVANLRRGCFRGHFLGLGCGLAWFDRACRLHRVHRACHALFRLGGRLLALDDLGFRV